MNPHPPPPPQDAAADVVQLDPDHPGFRDEEYRRRRNQIARIALEYRGGEVPRVEYTEEEHAVWRTVWKHLDPCHRKYAPRGYLILQKRLHLDRERIPQLADLNPKLQAVTGFEMHPVAGLIQGRTFLAKLSENVFLSTQYVRHHTVPLYTPEPDIVHELVGHAASFVHPMIAELNRLFGRAAKIASEEEMKGLELVYWWTMEFGALVEDNEVKAFGAGLLSSFGEIQRFRTEAELKRMDLDLMAETDYDPTTYQPVIWVADSWEHLFYELSSWLDEGGWRR